GAAAVLFERACLRGDLAPRREARKDVAPTLSARTGGLGTDFDLDGGLIAHALRAEGFDASEDGTGRGTPIVAQTITAEMYRSGGATAGNNPGVRNCIPVRSGVRRLTPRECERL